MSVLPWDAPSDSHYAVFRRAHHSWGSPDTLAVPRTGEQGNNTPSATPKRKPDPVSDAVVELFFGGTLAAPHRSRVGKIVRDFKALNATPDEIRQRLERYRATWPNAKATPESLVKHWMEFAAPAGALDAEPVEPADEVFTDAQ